MDPFSLPDLTPILGPRALKVTVHRRDTGKQVCRPVVLRDPSAERLDFYRTRYAGIVARKLGLTTVCEARIVAA